MSAEYELVIAIKDEPESWRKNAGDIIDWKPAPWQWGRKEVSGYLIVPIKNLSEDTLHRFVQPEYDNGKLLEEMTEKEMAEAKAVKKRRFTFPLDILKNGWCPDIDLERVADPEDNYQPLKDNNIVIDFDEHVINVRDNKDNTFRYDVEKIAE